SGILAHLYRGCPTFFVTLSSSPSIGAHKAVRYLRIGALSPVESAPILRQASHEVRGCASAQLVGRRAEGLPAELVRPGHGGGARRRPSKAGCQTELTRDGRVEGGQGWRECAIAGGIRVRRGGGTGKDPAEHALLLLGQVLHERLQLAGHLLHIVFGDRSLFL